MSVNSPKKSHVNTSLRRARKERFWSQKKLADKVGVDKGTISRWENGLSEPRPDELGRLCEALEKKPEELFPPGPPLNEPTSEREGPPSGNKPSNGTGPLPVAPVPPSRSRRSVVKIGVLAALGLAGGGTATWLLLTRLWVSRQWPTVGFDQHHRKEQVRVIQWMLKAHNLDIGPTGVDGVFGSRTQDAVIAFQQQQGLSSSGQVDSQTWEKLIIPSDVGSTGSHVFALQECLNLALKLVHKLGVDGDFGLQTSGSVRQFQQQQHLQENGGADLEVWYLLVKQVGEMTPE